MNVLIACEESQRVCTEFRKLGHTAYSCDLEECSGGHPEWHINEDCLPILNGNCDFRTQDGELHHITGPWDLMIAHPPCTYLTVSGNAWFNVEKYGDKARERERERESNRLLPGFHKSGLQKDRNRESNRCDVKDLPQARPDRSALSIRRPTHKEDLLVAQRTSSADGNGTCRAGDKEIR